jgi:hypothetical protein
MKTHMQIKPTLALAGVGVLLGVLAGCTSSSHTNATTPDPAGNLQLTNARIITQPSGFRNVSFGCWGHKGVYVTSRGQYASSDGSAPASSDVQVIVNDPDCA